MGGSILFYVSSHGFGHATRCIVLIEELKRRGVSVMARTAGSLAWLFEQSGVSFSAARRPPDEGMIQANALDVDLERTLRHHEALGAEWDQRVGEEAGVIAASGARLVVCDAPPLALAAAHRAGVPAVVVSNFSWDWIFACYAERQPSFSPVARRYAEAYARAKAAFRLQMSCPMPALAGAEEAPLLARRSSLDRAAARRALGLEEGDERPVVLVSFGGIKVLETDMRRSEDLSDFFCLGFTERPRGLKTEWLRLPVRSSKPHVDVVAACDVVLGKPGYGTFSEALAHRKPCLYVPRPDFPEAACLVEAMSRWGRLVALSRRDFEEGRWRAALEKTLESSAPWAEVDLGGETFIASRLTELLE